MLEKGFITGETFSKRRKIFLPCFNHNYVHNIDALEFEKYSNPCGVVLYLSPLKHRGDANYTIGGCSNDKREIVSLSLVFLLPPHSFFMSAKVLSGRARKNSLSHLCSTHLLVDNQS